MPSLTAELARMTAFFQMRTIATAMGADPNSVTQAPDGSVRMSIEANACPLCKAPAHVCECTDDALRPHYPAEPRSAGSPGICGNPTLTDAGGNNAH
jgi:hypothetical protein